MTGRGGVGARASLMVLAVASLVAATAGGLARAGLPLDTNAAGFHGALMVPGFFGTIIALERAAAVTRWWAFGAPILSMAASLWLLAGGAPQVAGAGYSAAAAIGTLASGVAWRRQPATHAVLLVVATLCLLAGNVLWTAQTRTVAVVPMWMAFLVMTITAERLELSRFTPDASRLTPWVVCGCACLVVAAVLTTTHADLGPRLSGAALMLLSGALVGRDVAVRTVRMPGLPRYAALAMLGGYLWLTAAGMLMVAVGLPVAGPHRDAALHMVFLGFVLPMVFGHAPIILPALLHRPFRFRRLLYLPLVLIHLTLAARVGTDLLGGVPLRWAASGNAITMAIFVLLVATQFLQGASRRHEKPRPPVATARERSA